MLGITTECSGSCKTSKMEYFANVINSRNTSSRTPHNFLRPSYNIRNYWGYYVLWVLLKASKKRQISQRKLYSFPWHIKTIKICYFVFIYHLLWHSLFYRNQSNDLQNKSTGWFLCHRDLRNERVKISVASFVVTLEWWDF